MRRRIVAMVALAGSLASGCGSSSETVARFGADGGSGGGGGQTPIPSRAGSVVVEGCQLDPWQTMQLQSPSAQAILQDVILLCPTARDDGTVAPVESSAQAELAQQVASIKGMGYHARLALTMADELGQPYSQSTMQASLASESWRSKVIAGVAPFAAMADGIDLQLPPPPDASQSDVTNLVRALSNAVGRNSLAVFVPPGGASTDVAGTAAYDLGSIGAVASRLHVLTLDYSCCTGSAGPTIDSGWAVDVMRATAAATSAPLDVAFPLYGWDFGPGGQKAVTFLDAQSVASDTGASVQRGPTGSLFYDWQDESGGSHETWFDDATSTSWTLAAWDTVTLPPSVGVVFWGLGSEDPSLWDTLASEVAR
jgi:spore germination protein YaaH